MPRLLSLVLRLFLLTAATPLVAQSLIAQSLIIQSLPNQSLQWWSPSYPYRIPLYLPMIRR